MDKQDARCLGRRSIIHFDIITYPAMKTGERNIFILMHRMKTGTDIWQPIGRRLHVSPFVIFPLSVLQGHDHLNKKRQEETDEDPVIEIFRHPRHPPDAHQSDEDKQHPRNDRPYKF